MNITPVPSRATVQTAMRERGMRPAAELAADKPCGTRVRYYAGCRCTLCKAVNTAYEKQRQQARLAGEWNGLVDAARARAHIEALSQRGVGWRTVADSAKVASTIVSKIKSGERTRLRAMAERRILAVTEACAADNAYIDAGPSWVLLDDLLACGYSRARIASEILGRKARALQLTRGHITVRNAERVRLVWERLRCASFQDSNRAQALLQDLSDEGFHRRRVLAALCEEAKRRGLNDVNLTPSNGRLQHITTEIIAAVHLRLVGEEEVVA